MQTAGCVVTQQVISLKEEEDAGEEGASLAQAAPSQEETRALCLPSPCTEFVSASTAGVKAARAEA